MEKTKLQWHPGFCAALRITLGEDLDFLEIREEHLLGKKPLQIDALVLKKLQDRTVEKAIGSCSADTISLSTNLRRII